MGIKTNLDVSDILNVSTLKNLPTTWGLKRRIASGISAILFFSEKPPRHSGIIQR